MSYKTVNWNYYRNVKCDGAIIVTTPQAVAVDDVLREVTFCRKTGIHIIGIIENMSGFVCPSCTVSTCALSHSQLWFNVTVQYNFNKSYFLQECTNIFSSGGGIALSEMVKVPFLAKVPIDPQVGKLADKGQSVLVTLPDSQVAQVFRKLVEELTKSKEAWGQYLHCARFSALHVVLTRDALLSSLSQINLFTRNCIYKYLCEVIVFILVYGVAKK